MPRPPCISIPFKKTAELDWVRPLRQYIARAYQEDPDVYTDDCQTLNRMRQDMRGANADETGRDLVFRYYSHLEALEPRFRINEQGVKVTFLWSDAFSSDSTQQHSLAFEKAGVLFNLAVAFGMHGASLFSDSSSEMELTTVHMAGIYFQVAADRFHYLNENFLHAPSLDLQQETVNVLNGIMMAQAQECALIKSRLEKKKDATLSKLAQQAALMYSNVVDNLKAIVDSHQLPRGWLQLVETKLRYYQAMAQYHEAHADESKGRYGMSIARYSLAEQHAREASKLVGQFAEGFFSTANLAEDLYPETVQGLQELITNLAAKITEELGKANHDNDVIYNEAVPNISTLPTLDAASVVSNFDINKFYASEERSNVVGGELFSRLIPMAVHESSSLYSEELAKMLRDEEDKVNLADGELEDALSFMKMPSSLKRFERPLLPAGADGRSGASSIIAELAEPSRAVREAAGSVQIGERSNPLAEMRARLEGQRMGASDELNDLSRMLDEEQHASEGVLSEHASEPLFVSYQPSSRAAAYYREQLSENQKKLEDAAGLDSSILNDYQSAVAPWLPTLHGGVDGVVSVMLEHLREVHFEEATDPQAAGGESLVDVGQDEPVGLAGHLQAIKDIYEQLLELRKIRRTALGELKASAQNDDISSALIKATSAKDLQPLFARELRKYDVHTQRLQAVSAKQGQLVKRISEEFRCMMELPQARVINDKWDMAEGKKAAVEAQILEASQVYRHVSDGLDKATRFYTLLLDSLSALRRQLKEFVVSRASQREQLVKQVLQDSAARSQAALKERLNQYAVPAYSQAQQTQAQPQRAYQSTVQNAYSPQHGPAQSPSVHSAQAFDMGYLANQAAQMTLHSPTGMPATLPPTQQQVQQQQLQQVHQMQPPYSPNGANAPQYQPSAPPPPQMMQHPSYMPQQPQVQQQQQPQVQQQPQPQQSQQLYGYQQQAQQNIGQYGVMPIGIPDATSDPYSAAVRRSTALEPSGLTNPTNPSYKPGYGGYTTTAAPIQASGGPITGYGNPNPGYVPGPGVSGPSANSASYAPAPHPTAFHQPPQPQPQQPQQPIYGSYSEPPAAIMVSAPMLHSTVSTLQQQQQHTPNIYSPPSFPPPAQAQNHHLHQPQHHHQPPTSYGSTVASNAGQPQMPLYRTPPAQQQQQPQQQHQQPRIQQHQQYLSQSQQQQQPLATPSYQQDYSQLSGHPPPQQQSIAQNIHSLSAYSNAVPTSLSYQHPSYLQQQQQQQPPQQYGVHPPTGYPQQQQQPSLHHGYGYQYSNSQQQQQPPPQQQQQQQPTPSAAGPYGGFVQTSQPLSDWQTGQPLATPAAYAQQQQPSYLPHPTHQVPQQQQQQQQPYHHGYGGNHSSLMD